MALVGDHSSLRLECSCGEWWRWEWTAVSSSAEGAKIWSYLIDLLCVGGVFTCGYACSAFRLAPCQRSLPGPRPGLSWLGFRRKNILHCGCSLWFFHVSELRDWSGCRLPALRSSLCRCCHFHSSEMFQATSDARECRRCGIAESMLSGIIKLKPMWHFSISGSTQKGFLIFLLSAISLYHHSLCWLIWWTTNSVSSEHSSHWDCDLLWDVACQQSSNKHRFVSSTPHYVPLHRFCKSGAW